MQVELLPKVISVKHSFEPTWASDAGRSSNNAHFSGTFKGYIDNLEVEFGHTTQAELTQIKNALEVPIIENMQFIDSKTGELVTEDFYGTTISVTRNSLEPGSKYSGFSISLIAIDPRG